MEPWEVGTGNIDLALRCQTVCLVPGLVFLQQNMEVGYTRPRGRKALPRAFGLDAMRT